MGRRYSETESALLSHLVDKLSLLSNRSHLQYERHTTWVEDDCLGSVGTGRGGMLVAGLLTAGIARMWLPNLDSGADRLFRYAPVEPSESERERKKTLLKGTGSSASGPG